ncbi:helix-turn-helix transcriptional regulator [Falsiroseomonas sp. HC035]|uniref:helix-turn-helix transcriptional regulator n=1 Tax=Falsiroseomonas sp. HC035 TaxID=3390999 RepID=UPI003D31CFE0
MPLPDAPPRHARLAEGLALLRFLAGSRGGRTIREMEQELGCGRRKIERLMRAIESTCGLLQEVETVEREKRWTLPLTPISRAAGPTSEELAELELSARTLQEAGLPHRAAVLRSVRDKLAARAPEAMLGRAEVDGEALLAAEGVAIRPGPRVALPPNLVGDLREALVAMRHIEISYRGQAGGERKHLLEPYGLLYGSRPYLLAAAPDKPDTALWRLDRIVSLRVMNEGFTPRFELAQQIADCFGVGRDTVRDVVLRFSPEAAADAATWRFHSSQETERMPDGSLIVCFRACGLIEMTNHFATWGDDVMVLSPPELREALADLGRRLSMRHRGRYLPPYTAAPAPPQPAAAGR